MTEQRWPDSNPPFHVGIIVDTSIDDEKRYRRSLSLLARLESSGKPPEPEELTEFAEALQVVKDTAKRGKIITEDVIPLCVWWLSLDSVALWWLSIFEQEAESLTAVALKKGFIHLQSLITELADTSLSEIAITAIRCAHKLVPHAFLRCCVADDDDGKLWHIVHQVYESVKLRVRSRNPQMQLVAIRFITLFAQIFTQRLTNPRMRRYPHDVSIALYKGGNQGFKTAKCEQYAETILDELLAFICDPGVTYPTGIINCVFIYARSRWKHAVAAIESLLHICKNMPIHWSTMQRRCVRRTILAGFSTLFRYAVSRSDRKTRDFILKAIEEIEETALVKTLILWEEGKRRGHAYPSSNEATTAEMTLNGDSITSKNERIGIGSRSGRVNATGNNRAFGNREPSNLIFVNKRDPRRKDGRFYGRLHVVDPFKQKGKRKKPKDKKATLDEDTLKPSESSNSIAESIPETPRPIIGMSYDHCILFMKSTIDRILYGRLVSLIVPSHLNWRVALDRCAAFLISRGEESDEALALVNNEEDLDIARTHLAQFFASGFNDWHQHALYWLYLEWYEDKEAYNQSLCLQLKLLFENETFSEIVVGQFILGIPELTNDAGYLLQTFCNNINWCYMILQCLRRWSLTQGNSMSVAFRQFWILSIQQDTDEIRFDVNREITRCIERNPRAIIEAKQLAELGLKAMTNNENSILIDWIKELENRSEKTMLFAESNDEQKLYIKDNREDREPKMVKHFLDIIFRAMTRRVNIITPLLQHYASYSIRTQMAIKAGIIETVLEIGQSCTELISTLCEAPKDANDLVAWIIRLFVSDGRPSQELRNAILDMEAREVEGAAIISWMLVTAVDHHHIESAVLKVLGAANSMDQLPSMIHSMIFWLERDLNIKSSDLFLMTIKNTSRQNAKRIGKVIDQFILMSDIFDRSVIQNSLTRAYNIRQPPVLLMRATMQIMRAYPEMLDVSLDLMDSLIQRPVWEVPQFESGFIRFVKMCQPRSLKLLKRLSISRRNRLLEEHSDLKTAYLFNERLS